LTLTFDNDVANNSVKGISQTQHVAAIMRIRTPVRSQIPT
jgi:hypothetical protein